MSRSILFITTDQQRYDALGCNGGTIARTPVADRLAREGVHYRRAHCQNVVCMPSRATMVTGQYPRTHGVIANGIALPEDAPNVVTWLKRKAGYRTALIGKAHFEPILDPLLTFAQNRLVTERSTGPWRGFDHVELAMHGPMGATHYARWLRDHHPGEIAGFAAVLSGAGGGDTGAPEVAHNPVLREHYHTQWVADRSKAYLSSLSSDDDFFLWMSFPDPHHPWDPPLSEVSRVRYRELELPRAHPGSPERIQQVLAQKPKHWLDWWLGKFRNPEGGPTRVVPSRLTHDQLREINAMAHVENELVDEACGEVLAHLASLGRKDDVDVFFTTDHGELQGDFGLLYKGPYHVDALMRVPFLWRPATSAAIAPAVIDEPVGHVDLAPTFCAIAGVEIPSWMEGTTLPTREGSGRQRVLTEWDSQFRNVGMHLRTMHRDGYTITAYLKSTRDQGGRFPFFELFMGNKGEIPRYDGTEGELYDHREDPWQQRNLWDDPAWRTRRSDLLADLRDHAPKGRPDPLPISRPV